MTEYVPGEPYEFVGTSAVGDTLGLRYRCWRGNCDARAVLVADRVTHNQYHDGHVFVTDEEMDYWEDLYDDFGDGEDGGYDFDPVDEATFGIAPHMSRYYNL